MSAPAAVAAAPRTDATAEYDAIIIGAGIAGMYQLSACASSACPSGSSRPVPASAAPGTGTAILARASTRKAIPMAMPSSEELLQDWDWSEHFAAQPETLRYLNHVADRFDLRRDIQFNSRVASAVFDDAARCWDVALDDGTRHRGRVLITAIGPLSADTLPRIPGVQDFRGQSFHTYRWPHAPVEFAGKRVAVIGTGATGVQVIQTIASKVGQLTVFQRTPNWCTPLHNRAITEEEQRRIKAGYPEMFELLRRTPGCYIHDTDPRGTFEVTEAEREAFWETALLRARLRHLDGEFPRRADRPGSQ